MNNTGGGNIFCIRHNKLPAVVTMPSRKITRSAAVVLTMPARYAKQSNVITLPSRKESSALDLASKPGAKSLLSSSRDALSYGVRMTLVALFALLGWPHPSRDNDPGPSAARPSHWELVSLISRQHLPSRGAKATAAIVQFPAAKVAMENEVRVRTA